jgi:kinesin family protein 11
MAALDEFVTRARTQNDSHHADRLRKLSCVVSRAQDRFAILEKDSHESKAALESLTEDQKQQRTDLDLLVGSLGEDTRESLLELKRELSDSNLAEYTSTGQTPQKRDWNYPTDLPRTENHDSIIARVRGLPDPALVTKTPSSAQTPARSPRKQTSPRKGPASPSKIPSPRKTKVFTDVELPKIQQATAPSQTQALTTISTTTPDEPKSGGLKEIDINVANSNKYLSASSCSSHTEEKPVLLDFSKSVGSGLQQPPLKRHATANAVVESRLPTAKAGRATRSTAAGIGLENFSQSVGPLEGRRRLRSSPPG